MTEYQKVVNLLENTLDQLLKFTIKTLIAINDQSSAVYNIVRFQFTMSSFCNYSDA